MMCVHVYQSAMCCELSVLKTSPAQSLTVPQAQIHGVIVQAMVTGARETILGMSRDPHFGPLLMFGLGGIYVEVLKDVAFRIAPIGPDDAREMTGEIRTAGLLKGARGEPPADVEAIVEGLLRLSQLVTDFPEIHELDINPLMVLPAGQGAVAIDARIALRAEDGGQGSGAGAN